MKLGDTVLVYANNEWTREYDGLENDIEQLKERNRVLEAENQLLRYKMQLLMDFATVLFGLFRYIKIDEGRQIG